MPNNSRGSIAAGLTCWAAEHWPSQTGEQPSSPKDGADPMVAPLQMSRSGGACGPADISLSQVICCYHRHLELSAADPMLTGAVSPAARVRICSQR